MMTMTTTTTVATTTTTMIMMIIMIIILIYVWNICFEYNSHNASITYTTMPQDRAGMRIHVCIYFTVLQGWLKYAFCGHLWYNIIIINICWVMSQSVPYNNSLFTRPLVSLSGIYSHFILSFSANSVPITRSVVEEREQQTSGWIFRYIEDDLRNCWNMQAQNNIRYENTCTFCMTYFEYQFHNAAIPKNKIPA